MRYMSEDEFKEKLREIERENETLMRIEKLEKERSRFQKPKKMSASKLALMAMFIIVFEIVVFTEYLMYTTQDLSALYVLIGIPATMIVPLWRYYSKSAIENSRGGITYDVAMAQIQQTQALTEEMSLEPGYDPAEDINEIDLSAEPDKDV